MKRFWMLASVLAVVALSATGSAYFKRTGAGQDMTAAVETFVAVLDENDRAAVLMPYDSPKRFDWHFIPKSQRKGLMLRDMNDDQRKAAHALLQSALSASGYDAATSIMQLEELLYVLEGTKDRDRRHPLKYYVTIFGKPGEKGRWGLSFEGHHLSLNFVVDGGRVISSTPQFLASNPSIVETSPIKEIKDGTRVLAAEELLAFELVQSLSDAQHDVALIADKAPAEIRAAGAPQPEVTPVAGLPAAKLNDAQQKTLHKLIRAYTSKMPADVAAGRHAAIEEHGIDDIHFAWAGATKPGIGHYYRVQGPSFLIEFVNTQPDASGNPARHVHCVWRDPNGDFAVPLKD